jgi:hypothetical protein
VKEENKIKKIIFNGKEIIPSGINVDNIEYDDLKPRESTGDIREIKSAEISVTLSRWQAIKLRWLMFKTEYLSKETTYIIKVQSGTVEKSRKPEDGK